MYLYISTSTTRSMCRSTDTHTLILYRKADHSTQESTALKDRKGQWISGSVVHGANCIPSKNRGWYSGHQAHKSRQRQHNAIQLQTKATIRVL
jgi:hypothetical protein